MSFFFFFLKDNFFFFFKENLSPFSTDTTRGMTGTSSQWMYTVVDIFLPRCDSIFHNNKKGIFKMVIDLLSKTLYEAQKPKKH